VREPDSESGEVVEELFEGARQAVANSVTATTTAETMATFRERESGGTTEVTSAW
jgi:hypothetical protein